MHADRLTGPMAGLPDPERDRQFYDGVPPRRFVAWCRRRRDHPAVGVPLGAALRPGDARLRLRALPAASSPASAFVYRTATLAGGSATWGMRFTGIEFRRGDGTRFDLP